MYTSISHTAPAETRKTEYLLRYGGRAILLYAFSLIFKSFDHTFVSDLSMTNFRGQVFSLFFVVFGLLVWDGAVGVARKTEQFFAGSSIKRRLILMCGVLLLYGMFIALMFGFFYGSFDILFFNRYEAWESFVHMSYDLHIGILLFYLMILAFNGIVVYYTAWKEYQLQTERLLRENIQAQYDALRHQIDPHFFFNSLSVLSNLVYKSADLSADYIVQLAKTYRYILDKKFENLVSVGTELDFLEAYLFLISIRHQQSIRFEVEIDEHTRNQGMVPPATLQLLVENAIKHNRFSAQHPLVISITHNGEELAVGNPLRRKANTGASSGIGLSNIEKRYRLLTGKGIHVSQADDRFTVTIPIIYSI
jgi:sensor histidine kinase YesM